MNNVYLPEQRLSRTKNCLYYAPFMILDALTCSWLVFFSWRRYSDLAGNMRSMCMAWTCKISLLEDNLKLMNYHTPSRETPFQVVFQFGRDSTHGVITLLAGCIDPRWKSHFNPKIDLFVPPGDFFPLFGKPWDSFRHSSCVMKFWTSASAGLISQKPGIPAKNATGSVLQRASSLETCCPQWG